MTLDMRLLVKQCLSISGSSTLKDDEIDMWINAGVQDLNRQGIAINDLMWNNPLIKSAVVMYVKSNFGMVDLKEKELARQAYNLLCNNLSLSQEFREVEAHD